MARIKTHPGEILREEFMAPLGLTEVCRTGIAAIGRGAGESG